MLLLHLSAMALKHTHTQAQLNALLYNAALRGSKRQIETTLAAGAELTFNNHMPLRIAVNTGQLDIVKLLISKYDVDANYAAVHVLRDRACGLLLYKIAECLSDALQSAKVVTLDVKRKKLLAPAA